jgi:hypothetical protein
MGSSRRKRGREEERERSKGGNLDWQGGGRERDRRGGQESWRGKKEKERGGRGRAAASQPIIEVAVSLVRMVCI